MLAFSAVQRAEPNESRFTLAGSGQVRNSLHTHDSLGRQITSRASVTNVPNHGPTFITAQTFDASTGRQSTRTFQTGVKVAYGYTALGFAKEIKLLTQANLAPLPTTAGGTPPASTVIAANTLLWQARVVNALGQAEKQLLANGINIRATIQGATGRTTALTAGLDTSNAVVNRSYTWDSLNNLTQRIDHIGGDVIGAVTETFERSIGVRSSV